MTQPLESEKQEQFCRCISSGNKPVICAVAAGYPRNLEFAEALAQTPRIASRIRTLEMDRLGRAK